MLSRPIRSSRPVSGIRISVRASCSTASAELQRSDQRQRRMHLAGEEHVAQEEPRPGLRTAALIELDREEVVPRLARLPCDDDQRVVVEQIVLADAVPQRLPTERQRPMATRNVRTSNIWFPFARARTREMPRPRCA